MSSDERPPSKSQVKRDLLTLQDLAEAVAKLTPTELDGLRLPLRFRAALNDYNALSNLPAKRRQLQFLGKLLREVHQEPLHEAVARGRGKAAVNTRTLKLAEQWRTRLLKDDEGWRAWCALHGESADLRSQLVDARIERERGAAGPQAKKLFGAVLSALQQN